MNERIIELKKQIEEQGKINVELYNSIPLPTHDDPNNEKSEPILKLWRDGSKKIKELMRELQELELSIKKSSDIVEQSKKFVNSFGEATERNIICNTYERQQKKLSKQILSYMS